MRAILCLSVLASLAGCANPQRTALVYPFQRPVAGLSGQPLPITDAHWTACDLDAVQLAFWERPPSSALGRMHLASLGLGTVLANEEMQKAESPATTAFREATYERLMRACLVNLGYAIAVPPPPSRAFGQYALA
jgi:hypothetical protein